MKRLALFLLLTLSAWGQTATLMPMPRLQFFDTSGNPLAGGKVYTYAAGTTTPLVSYSDQSAAFPNSNPVILDSGGFGTIWLGPSAYKIVVQNSAGVPQWTVDKVSSWVDLTSNQTIGGNKTFTGAMVVLGTATFNGQIFLNGISSAQQLNNVLYVGDGVTGWAGADIGAQINTAYNSSSCPAGGCVIRVIPSASGCYSQTTTVNFDTQFKPVRLESSGSTISCITYTGTGTMFTANWGGGHSPSVGFYNLDLRGSGGSSIGLDIGNVRNTDQPEVIGNRITSFGTGVKVENASFNILFQHNHFGLNTIGIDCTSCGEMNRWFSNTWSGNGIGIDATAIGNEYFAANSCDDSTTTFWNFHSNTSALILSFSNHCENVSGTTAKYISSSGVSGSPRFESYGDKLTDDVASGTLATMIDLSGFLAVKFEGLDLVSAGRTITTILTVSGSPNVKMEVINSNGTLFPSYCTGCSGGRAVIDELVPPGTSYSNTYYTRKNLIGDSNSLVTFGNTVNRAASNFTTSSGTLVTLFTWNLPAVAHNYSFECRLTYQQATAGAGLLVGFQSATVSPTSMMGTARIYTTLTGTNTSATAVVTNTTATTILTSAALGAITTNYDAMIFGTIENPANLNAFNIMVATAAGADQITILRGSFCQLY